MANEPRRVKHLIESLCDEIDKLSEWEQSFLRSVEEQFRKNCSLSDKQYDKLEAIYAYYLAVNCYGLYLWRKRDGKPAV